MVAYPVWPANLAYNSRPIWDFAQTNIMAGSGVIISSNSTNCKWLESCYQSFLVNAMSNKISTLFAVSHLKSLNSGHWYFSISDTTSNYQHITH